MGSIRIDVAPRPSRKSPLSVDAAIIVVGIALIVRSTPAWQEQRFRSELIANSDEAARCLEKGDNLGALGSHSVVLRLYAEHGSLHDGELKRRVKISQEQVPALIEIVKNPPQP
jgi:hypothetical protein